MIGVSSRGSFGKTKGFLDRIHNRHLFRDLDQYGRMGVSALRAATPVDTGLTAESWEYRIVRTGRWPGIEWYNTNMVNGTPVAILIQYSHGTGTGGFIQGRDYINPAMRPIFNQIANEMWEKVRNS